MNPNRLRTSAVPAALAATLLVLAVCALPAAADDAVARGKYLVALGGCNDCHTPWALGPNGPAPDMTRPLSGHPEGLEMPPAPELGHGPWLWTGAATNTAFAGPWGVSFAPNLTPHPESGLGSWTRDVFVRAIRTGKHLGAGRPILPPMPVSALNAATDEDLDAIWAYLQSLEPIDNLVPQPLPPAAPAVERAATR